MSLIKNLLIVIFFSSLISGCNLTGGLWGGKGETNEHPVYKEDRAGNVVSQREIEKRERLISQYIEEWEMMKPSLTNIIAMEGDLTYVLSALEEAEGSVAASKPDEFVARFDDVESSEVTSLSAKSKTTQLRAPVNDGVKGSSTDKFIVKTSNTSTQNVALGSLSPISSKFTTKSTPSQPKANTSDGKFSDNKLRNIQADSKPSTDYAKVTDLCGNENLGEIGSGYAIHLASYSNYDSVGDGRKTFQTKYGNTLCGKASVVKAVNVKGKGFYSLRFGPYANKAEAQADCELIRSKSSYCAISMFEGERFN